MKPKLAAINASLLLYGNLGDSNPYRMVVTSLYCRGIRRIHQHPLFMYNIGNKTSVAYFHYATRWCIGPPDVAGRGIKEMQCRQSAAFSLGAKYTCTAAAWQGNFHHPSHTFLPLYLRLGLYYGLEFGVQLFTLASYVPMQLDSSQVSTSTHQDVPYRMQQRPLRFEGSQNSLVYLASVVYSHNHSAII